MQPRSPFDSKRNSQPCTLFRIIFTRAQSVAVLTCDYHFAPLLDRACQTLVAWGKLIANTYLSLLEKFSFLAGV
jgi:hypothetical protein